MIDQSTLKGGERYEWATRRLDLLVRRDTHDLASSRRKSEPEIGDIQTSIRTQSDRCRKSESVSDNLRSPRWLEAPDAADERRGKSAGGAHFQHVHPVSSIKDDAQDCRQV